MRNTTLPSTGAFVGYRGGEKIDYSKFLKVSGDAKAKQPFLELKNGLESGPVRLRLGTSSKALAMRPGADGLAPEVMGLAKSLRLTVYRRDALGWIHFALIRQRPLLVEDGEERFVVVPRVDARWADEAPPSAFPSSHDGLAAALLTSADRLVALPTLVREAAGIRVELVKVGREFHELSGELKSATAVMLDLAGVIAAVSKDVRFALAVAGQQP